MTKEEWMTPEEYIAKVEEENKKLKEQLERMKTDTMYDMKDINSLYKENKKLKEELSKLKEKYWDIDY